MGSTARADPDPWFGADKGAHFAVSSALAIGGYGAAATFSESLRVRVVYGASVALLAGIGKELWDASGTGSASAKDLTWDLLGTVVGVAICWAIDELFFRPIDVPNSNHFGGGTTVHPERSTGSAGRPFLP